MDAGDLDFPCEQLLDMTNSSSSFDMDDFFLQSQSCTHAHACSPPGPDKTHTHTCIHVHTQIMPEAQHPSDDTSESAETKAKKRPSGNREAVRKYRERKKAKTASLEDEVVRLRALNGQLVKKLQNQALLEAEVSRLKCLLVDIRGRVDGEIGSFPYGKPVKSADGVHQKFTANNNIAGSYVMNSCNVQCDDQLDCLWHGLETAGVNGQGLGDCELGNLNCLGNVNGNGNSSPKEVTDCGAGYVNKLAIANNSNSSRRKSGACSGRAS